MALPAALTIAADGSISRGPTRVRARISGTSPRVLTTDLDPSYAGLPTRPGVRVDVTHVWHSPDLPAIVAALLADAPLPAGYALGARRDGLAMVRTRR